jgi:hypothetical protein
LSFTITKKYTISHSSWKLLSFALLWNTHFPLYWVNGFITDTYTHTDAYDIDQKSSRERPVNRGRRVGHACSKMSAINRVIYCIKHSGCYA